MRIYSVLISIFLILMSSANSVEKKLYEITFKDLSENTIKLSDYKNKVILVVNVASRCGFTKQYEGLQTIWEKYKNNGLIVLGVSSNSFNQELDTSKKIKNFCESKFGITFPVTKTVEVKGDAAHDFYKWALKSHGKSTVPKWNFYKILIDKNRTIIDTYSSMTKPTSEKLNKRIEDLL